jgi:hypothetical protein
MTSPAPWRAFVPIVHVQETRPFASAVLGGSPAVLLAVPRAGDRQAWPGCFAGYGCERGRLSPRLYGSSDLRACLLRCGRSGCLGLARCRGRLGLCFPHLGRRLGLACDGGCLWARLVQEGLCIGICRPQRLRLLCVLQGRPQLALCAQGNRGAQELNSLRLVLLERAWRWRRTWEHLRAALPRGRANTYRAATRCHQHGHPGCHSAVDHSHRSLVPSSSLSLPARSAIIPWPTAPPRYSR